MIEHEELLRTRPEVDVQTLAVYPYPERPPNKDGKYLCQAEMRHTSSDYITVWVFMDFRAGCFSSPSLLGNYKVVAWAEQPRFFNENGGGYG